MCVDQRGAVDASIGYDLRLYRGRPRGRLATVVSKRRLTAVPPSGFTECSVDVLTDFTAEPPEAAGEKQHGR
jgi:hypothetical protein